MRSWRCTFIVFVIIVLITAACGGGTPPGGGAPADVGGSTQSSTQAPTNQPPAAQPAKAAGGGTQKAINLSASDQPGNSIKSKVADSIKVGRKVDTSKPEIGDLLWTMPPDTPKIYFGFTAKNTEERAFTQKLFVNGSEVNLPDLHEVPVPPVPPGKKLFVAQGLAVKPGNSFPVGDYRIDVYSQSDGKLIQSTDWNVKEKRPAAAALNFGWLPIAAEIGFLWNSAHTDSPAPIDPSIFTVVEVPDEIIDQDLQYYDDNELEQAYQDLDNADQEYEPFSDEIQQEIEAQSDLDNASQCEQADGTYDAFNDLCYVNNDPTQACQDLGGTYQNDSCFFFPSDEIPLSEDIQQAIEGQSDQDNASLCEQAGGTYDASNDLCNVNGDPASVPSDEATPEGTPTLEGGEAASPDALTPEDTPTPEPPADTSEPTPPAPVPTSPLQGDTIDGSTVPFSWEAVPDTNGVTYAIEVIGDDDNSVTQQSDIDGTSWTVTLGETGCNFHWEVRAVQNGVEGPWSESNSFSICAPQ